MLWKQASSVHSIHGGDQRFEKEKNWGMKGVSTDKSFSFLSWDSREMCIGERKGSS
jgi:hypothetical protein